MEKNATLIPRFLVMNKIAIFIYKDELAFKSFPKKPSVVIPIREINGIETHTFNQQEILRQ